MSLEPWREQQLLPTIPFVNPQDIPQHGQQPPGQSQRFLQVPLGKSQQLPQDPLERSEQLVPGSLGKSELPQDPQSQGIENTDHEDRQSEELPDMQDPETLQVDEENPLKIIVQFPLENQLSEVQHEQPGPLQNTHLPVVLPEPQLSPVNEAQQLHLQNDVQLLTSHESA